MLEFILTYDNLPFFVCAVVVLMLAVIETFARVAGLSLVSLLDDPETEANASPSTWLAHWLCLDKLPVLLWCILALSLFSVCGFLINITWLLINANTLPQSISLWLVFPLTGAACHWLGNRHWWRYDQQFDEENADLSGSVAVMTLGTAEKGIPAEALVKDSAEHRYYVMVEPRDSESRFQPGTWVVLLTRRERVWLATKFEP